MSGRIAPEVAKAVAQSLLHPSMRPPNDAGPAVPSIVADASYIVPEAASRPWPSAPDFDPVRTVVGSTSDFEWIASGPTALLWRAETEETVLLREVEGRIVSIHASKVNDENGLVWWVFLATASSITWCSVDADVGSVAFIAETKATRVARILACSGKALVVSEDAAVSLLVPNIAAGSLTILGNQSWASWARGWIRPGTAGAAALVDVAVDEDRSIAYVLDSRANLRAWNVLTSGGPAADWTTALELPVPAVSLYATRGLVVLSSQQGDRFVCDVTSKPGKTTTPDRRGNFESRVSRVVHNGPITVVIGASSFSAQIHVEAPALWHGPRMELHSSCMAGVTVGGVVDDASIRFVGHDRAVVTLLGTFGTHRVEVASVPRMVANSFREQRNSELTTARLAEATSCQNRATWLLLDALDCAIRHSDNDASDLGAGFAALAFPHRLGNGAFEISAPAAAVASSVREAADAAFVCCAAPTDDFLTPLVSLSGDDLADIAQRLWRVSTAITYALTNAGLLSFANTTRVSSSTWVTPIGAAPSVRWDSRECDPSGADSAALGLQAQFLTGVQAAAERLARLCELLSAAKTRIALNVLEGATMTVADLVQPCAHAPDGWALTCLRLARALCQLSAAGADIALAQLSSEAAMRTEVTAWIMVWDAALAADAREFVCDHVLALHHSGGLRPLADRIFAEPTEAVRLCIALRAAAEAAHDNAARHEADELLRTILSNVVSKSDVLEAVVRMLWEGADHHLQRVAATWLVNSEGRPDGLRLAKLFAAAPERAVQKLLQIPSACGAEYQRAHDKALEAAIIFTDVAAADGTLLPRRQECVAAGMKCCPADALDVQEALAVLKYRVGVQHELYDVVRSAVDGAAALGLDESTQEVAEGHLANLETLLLDEQILFDAARQYRALGGALIELKILARSPAAEARDWTEAIEAAVDAATQNAKSEEETKRIVKNVAGSIVREAKTNGAGHLPLSFVVSMLEGLCAGDEERLNCLLSANASADEIFEAYMHILDDRGLLHPAYEPDAHALLLIIAAFVKRAADWLGELPAGGQQQDQLRRMFNAVRACVSRQQVAMRTNRGAPQVDPRLAQAEQILDECEDSTFGGGVGGMSGGMGSQMSFVY